MAAVSRPSCALQARGKRKESTGKRPSLPGHKGDDKPVVITALSAAASFLGRRKQLPSPRRVRGVGARGVRGAPTGAVAGTPTGAPIGAIRRAPVAVRRAPVGAVGGAPIGTGAPIGAAA